MSTPFDLHVLSTPPAFILSQDQTLNKMVFNEPKLVKSILLKLNSSFKEIINGCLYKLFWAFTTNSFWCFVFVMLFNLQGAHRSQRRAFILPQLVFLVKHFFQAFSNSFALSFAELLLWRAVPADSLIILPRSFFLVKHFFQVFSNFFVPFQEKPRWRRCPRRQLIEDTTVGAFCQGLFSDFLIFFHILCFLVDFFSKFHPQRTFDHKISSCGSTFLVLPLFYPH